MNIVLVHDQLNEFGGAERVLLALSDMYPDAPIYTAYYKKGSLAWERFKNKNIRVSWVHYIPFFSTILASPLRFLAPLIWNSFDFSKFDVIIGSSSWYVTKGFRKEIRNSKFEIRKNQKLKPVEICYCHTPPRWLYGYPTSVQWQKYTIVRIYAAIVGFFMRHYDFDAAQRVDYFIANSKETQRRIAKFYRRKSTVIYPPIGVNSKFEIRNSKQNSNSEKISIDSKLKTLNTKLKSAPYYLFVSRPVGSKGLELAIEVARKLGIHLKIVGRSGVNEANVEYLGIVSDEDLAKLYVGAKAFLALATDEDFGMTPVEAMVAGTPVIAYNGGGYVESVVDGKTGILFNDPTVNGLIGAIDRFEKLEKSGNDWSKNCVAQAKKFSTERFRYKINDFIRKIR